MAGEDKGRPLENISDLLHDGKKGIVQVIKGPLGTKGVRLTMQLSVSARYLVLLPHTDHIGVSQLLEDPGERPLFELYGVEDEIHRALDRRVELKSGGYLIID